ncbi:MAG: hypothetical protein KUL83_06330 [Lentimicrobium sp.]|jgi:hypothetical protein|nr:hypothetical protein [Lentimicrobium sp.]MDD2527154.1 hypothetical protein [Lentimicrobiaceae bacterium]MDD4598064.1 hypothetical protein [Lentimicrobiaceae bacterium]MDY0025734.1 hypothetical protein [Lentimicrobium sp.]HAH57277.1 hypothetical protein [Bacteroidales bacterium]
MEDFLFIIIGIVWLVYSFYNSKQKAQRKQAEKQARSNGPATPTPVPKRSFLEELLDPEPPVVRPVVDPEEAWEESYSPAQEAEMLAEAQSLEKIEEEYTDSYFERQYADRNRVSETERVIERVTEEPVILVEEIIEEEFDLRKAVIYAEILNPRYI